MLRRVVLALALVSALLAESLAPAFAHVFPEIEPQCHRTRDFTGRLYFYFKFDPITFSHWQEAYENAGNEWRWTPTPLYVYYSSTATQASGGTQWVEGDGRLGWTNNQCDSRGNLYYSHMVINTWQESIQPKGYYTATEKQQLAGHEMGHALGLGHIPNWYSQTAIMRVFVPDGTRYWIPNWADEEFVNHVYPGGYY